MIGTKFSIILLSAAPAHVETNKQTIEHTKSLRAAVATRRLAAAGCAVDVNIFLDSVQFMYLFAAVGQYVIFQSRTDMNWLHGAERALSTAHSVSRPAISEQFDFV